MDGLHIPPKLLGALVLVAGLALVLDQCTKTPPDPSVPPPAVAAPVSDASFQGKTVAMPGGALSALASHGIGPMAFTDLAAMQVPGVGDELLDDAVFTNPAFLAPEPRGAVRTESDVMDMVYRVSPDGKTRPVTTRIERGLLNVPAPGGTIDLVLDAAPYNDHVYHTEGHFAPTCVGMILVDGLVARDVRYMGKASRPMVNSDTPGHLRVSATVPVAAGQHDVAFVWRCLPIPGIGGYVDSKNPPESIPSYAIRPEVRLPGSGRFLPAFSRMSH